MTTRTLAAASLLLLSPALLRADATAILELRVRDADTGAALEARVAVAADHEEILAAELSAVRTVTVPATRRIAIAADAPGHAPIATHAVLAAGQRLAMTLWLDPSARVKASPPGAAPGTIGGFLYDASTGEPLAGARVALLETGDGVTTAADGAFTIAYDVSPSSAAPRTGTVLLMAAGYRARLVRGVVLGPGRTRMIEDLGRGSGEEVRDDTPLPLRPPGDHQDHQAEATVDDAALSGPARDISTLAPGAPPSIDGPRLVGMTPPASIRVGTSCSCSSCSGVSVMSLESYVAGGLDNEWISSWAAHSLRSGAVPYRSYGAWYVQNPINGSYDICSTTCCQVYGSTTYSSTVSAANLTAGFMLERSGSVFRAEYSAENNALLGTLSCVNGDLSCGNGYAGSPAASWPCLSDSVCAGTDCFGHGRGMCQWGTSRWASGQGRLWNWIADHYYNDNGPGSGLRNAHLTSPITMPAFSPSPATVSPGGTFTIDVTASNAAGLDHGQIMIGASLYSTGAGYISDPQNDTKVFLPVGTGNVSRPFVVPASTAAGSYDLIVALWYDTDGDDAITSADLSLLLATSTGAVTVLPSCGTITLSPATLPGGTVGSAYSQTIGASGGTSPYAFAVSAGTLPPGLALASTGTLSGAPTTAGSFSFTVSATDSTGCSGSRAYAVTIATTPALGVNVVAGKGLGMPNDNRVKALRADGTATGVDFLAYAAGKWGVNVAAAQMNGAAAEQILTGPGPGDVFGPQVRAFDRTGTAIGRVNFFAYGTLRYGVNVAAGRLDADALAEILTGAGPGSVFGPHVRGFDYDGSPVTAIAKINLFAYSTLRFGVNVGSGALDGDVFAEILTGPGPGAVFGPQVRGFDYDATSVAAISKINFNAYAAGGYGAFVAAADVDGDGYGEIATAPGAGPAHAARFKGFDFDAAAIAALAGFDVTVGSSSFGGRVGLGDVDGDMLADLVAGAGPDPAASAMVTTYAYGGTALTPIASFKAFPAATYGVDAAGADLRY